MSNTLYSHLSDVFPVEMERTITKSGTNLTYIPVSEVINRLNKVLGVDKWSFTILRCERDAIDPEFIVAHVRIDWYHSDFGCVSRDGFGGQKIKRTKAGAIVDLGDEFKGAISDALKKAAQTLGVGLYLARSEDAMEIEQVMDAEQGAQPVQVQEQPNTEISQKWDEFVSISKALNAEQKAKLNEYWDTYSGGKPKPTKATATLDVIERLLAEAIRIQFNGTYVIEQE